MRYECCAADVIRELGYPSREALRMWHHDWLEERKTGVPSTSGERYACYTTEQKRAAVDHYLTHGRRASRTIRRSGHPGREALAAWLDGPAPGERRLRHGPVSEELEREAVPRVASGGMTSRRTRRSRAWIRRSCGTGGGNRPARRKGPWAAKGEPEREDVAAQADPDVPRGGIAALNADPERLRAEYRAMETGPVIMRGSVEPAGKAPGADTDDLTDREKSPSGQAGR